MRFTAYNRADEVLYSQAYYSIGGGFIVKDEDFDKTPFSVEHQNDIPFAYLFLLAPVALACIHGFSFHTASRLLELCNQHNLSIAEVQLRNELAMGRTEAEAIFPPFVFLIFIPMLTVQVKRDLLNIWYVMDQCIQRGLESRETHLPGGLNVLFSNSP